MVRSAGRSASRVMRPNCPIAVAGPAASRPPARPARSRTRSAPRTPPCCRRCRRPRSAGKPHLIVSSISGHPSCTSARRCRRIGRANASGLLDVGVDAGIGAGHETSLGSRRSPRRIPPRLYPPSIRWTILNVAGFSPVARRSRRKRWDPDRRGGRQGYRGQLRDRRSGRTQSATPVAAAMDHECGAREREVRPMPGYREACRWSRKSTQVSGEIQGFVGRRPGADRGRDRPGVERAPRASRPRSTGRSRARRFRRPRRSRSGGRDSFPAQGLPCVRSSRATSAAGSGSTVRASCATR